MRERGKAVETYRNLSDFNYSASEIPCKKHPYSSPVGICAYCLKERLMKLVCSECGEKRISSCSCSEFSSSYRNSCSKTDVGSVGRISFLIDNEKNDNQQRNRHSKSKRRDEKTEQVVFLRRSSSSCVEIKKSSGFWRIKRLFTKRREKGRCANVEFCDENSDMSVSDIVGVSRSKSLCSFRGGRNNDFDEGSDYVFSNAKISDVSSGIFFDSDKQYGINYGYEHRKSRLGDGRGGCHNQMEIDRVCSFPNRSVFPIKESEFSVMDESAFIDLKLDSMSEDCSVGRMSRASDHVFGLKSGDFEIGENLASLKGNGLYGNGGSCRITMNERELKHGRRNYKVWKWIFKYHI